MAHTYSNLLIHAIFGTKDHRRLLDTEVKSEVFPYMGGIIRNLGGVPIIINGSHDHVHALFGQPVTLSVSDMMEKLKANSSKWVHQRWPQRRLFAWQQGYAAFSVSHSRLGQVRSYIESQEKHHAKQSFREELAAFLKKNDISYDPRYVGP
jgi:REP-associated tyrosine transposase